MQVQRSEHEPLRLLASHTGLNGRQRFATVLRTSMEHPFPAMSGQLPAAVPEKAEKIDLGAISTETPTVSDLLRRHPELRHRIWEIVHAPANRDKPYTTLRPGTRVLFDPASGALEFSPPVSGSSSPDRQPDDRALRIGVISDRNPTVSHLLRRHPGLRDDAWQILAAPGNRDRAFTSLRPGTVIYYRPENSALE